MFVAVDCTGGGTAAKLAVTVVLEFIVTVPALAPPVAPVQLLNEYPLFAFAVKFTTVPATYCVPQFAAVFTVTLPLPLGLTAVVRV